MPLVKVNRGQNELQRLHDEMDSLFGTFFGGLPRLSAFERVWPAIDVAEDEHAVTVKAEVPGCSPDDIDISVQGTTLTISGEKKQEEEKKEKGWTRVERSYGSFRRDITLPSEVDENQVDAKYKNGVLEITMPKSEKAKPKKIQIKSE